MRWWVAAMTLAAGAAHAQAALSAYNGVYLYEPADGDLARIDAAIDEATEDMGLVRGEIAENRLEEVTEPFPRLEVHFDTDHALLRYGEREYEMPLDGEPVPATGVGGASVETSAHMRGDTFYQTLQGERGARHVELRFDSDDSLSMVTRIESRHLPSAVSYTLHYRRAR